jgi:NDMA-dependent alcohol dehydrogenase
MKAAVCYEFGKPLVVEDIDIDPPKEGEVKARIAATSICHSDIHLIKGEWGGTPPIVAGHESAGIVEEVGPGVTSVKPGDHVVVSLIRSCGRCLYCTTGLPHKCEAKWPLDAESRLHNKRGEPLKQGLYTASFAEHVVVDQSQVVRIPDDMPLQVAALLACGVITGVGAVVNTAQVKTGSSVAVIGAGGVGLNAVQGAILSGAHPIIAVDRLDNKLASARTFGATHTVNATKEDAIAAVKDITGGRGADYVFVTVGSADAVAQGFAMLRHRGMEVIVGIPESSATASLTVRDFVVGEKMVMGSRMGSTRLSVDVPRLVGFYRSGRLKLDELITARYPLERINEAIDAVLQGRALRNVIVF